MKRSITCAVIFFSCILSSCTRDEHDPSQRAQALSPVTPEVVAVEIAPGPIYKTYTSVGSVAAIDIARIGPKVSGRIMAIHAEEGQRVRQGDLLMLIDPFDYEQALNNAAAIRNQAKVTLARAERDRLRMESLYRQKSVSQQTFQDTLSARDLARYEYDQAVAALETAGRNLEECSVCAPIPGIVTQKEVHAGELASPGQLAFVIMNMDTVKVEVDLPEEVYSSIREGSQGIITLDALPGRTFAGTITRVYPTVDPMSRTLKVTITLDNPSLLLRPGMTARSRVVQKARESALFAPKSAIIQGEQGYFVYIVNGNAVKKTPVKVGMEGDSAFEILEGADQGDLVVTMGLAGLRDGMTVRIGKQEVTPDRRGRGGHNEG